MANNQTLYSNNPFVMSVVSLREHWQLLPKLSVHTWYSHTTFIILWLSFHSAQLYLYLEAEGQVLFKLAGCSQVKYQVLVYICSYDSIHACSDQQLSTHCWSQTASWLWVAHCYTQGQAAARLCCLAHRLLLLIHQALSIVLILVQILC